MDYVSTILCNMESGYQTDAIYLDFSKAFDSLDHSLLVKKLAKYGVSGVLREWLSSYLTGRTQRVRVKDQLSATFMATSGVPQGSHLGPLLFLIYIEDLARALPNVECSAYADDLKIYKAISSDVDQSHLQDALDLVHGWGVTNNLKLNSSKCQVLTFSRARTPSLKTYNIDNIVIKRVQRARDLGVLLDNKLDFRAHIDQIIAKARSVLGLVKRFSREFADPSVTRTLYCSLVRSLLEYASPVWSPHYASHEKRIESVQKQFLLFALGNQRLPDSFTLPPYRERLALINLDTLSDRRRVASVSFVYDCLMGTIHSDRLRAKITINNNRRGRHSTYLYTVFHRTVYGKNEPLTRCTAQFNEVADLFLSGLSRVGFRRAVVQSYRGSANMDGHPLQG